MKKMRSLLSLLLLLFVFTMSVAAQPAHHKKGKKIIKQLHLTSQQKHELKTFHKSAKQQVTAIKNNTALSEQQKKEQLEQLKEKRHEKLEAILTPEQKEKLKELKKEGPRRGVTNMPNERKAK